MSCIWSLPSMSYKKLDEKIGWKEYLQWKAINEWNGQMSYTIAGSSSLHLPQLSAQQLQLLSKQNSQQNQTRLK